MRITGEKYCKLPPDSKGKPVSPKGIEIIGTAPGTGERKNVQKKVSVLKFEIKKKEFCADKRPEEKLCPVFCPFVKYWGVSLEPEKG